MNPYMMESPALGKLAVLLQDSGRRPTSPILVGWLVTLKCQLRCRHCWIDRRFPEASPAVRETIARRLAEANLCRVVLSGGEPTLLPELGRYVRILKESGTPLSLCTNAMDPIGHARGRPWLDFWDRETDYAQVSLDGGDRKPFEAQRGRGTFGRFLKGVDLLRRNGVRLLARYIATPFNGADVHAAARLSLDLGFEGFSAELFYPQGRAASLGLEAAVRTARRFNASTEALLLDAGLTGSSLELGISFPVEVRPPRRVLDALPKRNAPLRIPLCDGTLHGFVMPSGEVCYSTHLDAHDAFRHGSLREDRLPDLWKASPGPGRRPGVRDLRGALCASCPDFHFCRGGRAERAWSHWGTFDAHDPWCHFGREA
jgi:MoaA/NifB/PqqE/SkfB family radical SAM enzyme